MDAFVRPDLCLEHLGHAGQHVRPRLSSRLRPRPRPGAAPAGTRPTQTGGRPQPRPLIRSAVSSSIWTRRMGAFRSFLIQGSGMVTRVACRGASCTGRNPERSRGTRATRSVGGARCLGLLARCRRAASRRPMRWPPAGRGRRRAPGRSPSRRRRPSCRRSATGRLRRRPPHPASVSGRTVRRAIRHRP